jgi:23S rRNA (guanosine2251-2'-O)-methyltransferase
MSKGHRRDQPEEDENIIYGVHPVIEAVRAKRPINKIFIQKGMNKELFYELKDALADKKYHLAFVPIHKLNRMTKKNHQGVIAQVSPVDYVDIEPILTKLFEEGEVPLFLILDRLTDVRNFGAIARTAECNGVHGIIIPQKDSVSVTADAVKTSAGALNKIPVSKVEDLSSVIHFLKNSGLQIVASTEKSAKLLQETDLTLPTAIVMGSEEDGVSTKILTECDVKVKIPMFGEIGSLNVSVSAGIILYEVNRQRMG